MAIKQGKKIYLVLSFGRVRLGIKISRDLKIALLHRNRHIRIESRPFLQQPVLAKDRLHSLDVPPAGLYTPGLGMESRHCARNLEVVFAIVPYGDVDFGEGKRAVLFELVIEDETAGDVLLDVARSGDQRPFFPAWSCGIDAHDEVPYAF